MTENFGEVVHDGFNVEISSIEMKDLGLNEFSRFQKKFSSIVDDPIRLFSSVGGRYEIENIMKELINPLVKKFSLRYQNLIDDPKQSLEGLRKFHRFIYLSTYYSLPNWDPSKIDSVDNFIDLLFEENFVKKFDQTEKKKGSKAITNIFTQSIEHASLIYLFEKVKARFNIPKNEPLTGPDFIKMIRDFRKNTDKNQFFSDFLRKYLPYVFFKYGESFCTGTKSLYMQFDNNPSTQIGWHAENAAYFTIFPFFELISLIENNYDLKTVEVLKYYTYNPYGRDNKIQTSDMERVLDGKDAKDIFDKINNYKNLFGKFSNWAEMDLSTISREGESLSNWEVKNSKDSGSTYLMNILIDSFRSIYLATSRSVAIEKVDIEKAKEHLVLAIDVDDKQSLKSIITDRLVSLKRPQDLANQPQRNYEKRKYSKYLELLGRLCEEINKLINTNDIDIFYENLILLFQTKNFRKNINEITKEIFGKSNSQKEKEKIDLLKNIFEIESLTRWLKSGKINPILPRFTNFLIKDSNDKLKFNFGAFFNVYLKTEKLVNEDIFINPQISFFFIGGILKESQDLTEREKERILSGNLAIVHNSKKKNGIMLVDKPSMKLEGTDKDGKSVQIEDGFYSYFTGVIRGVFISKSGHLLRGPVSFDPTIGFYFTSQQSLSSLLFNNINEESLTSMYHLTYSPKIDTYYRFNYLRSASHLSGSQVTYLIQDVDSMTIPIGSHKMLISGYEIKNRRQSIFKREMVSSSTQNKISLISNLISSLSRSARKENPDIFVPDVTFQSTEESQLIIEKRTGRIISEDYTRDHFNNILRSMDLTDEMLVTMFYYTVDNEGKTVWHLKNDGTLTDTKDYYRSWLKAIRNSISNPSEEFNHYFSKFDYLIQPSFEFSSGKKFIVEKDPSNPQDYIFNDPYLAKLVDKALIESFGYEAFMLLSNGFLTFSPKDEGYDCFIRTHFRSKNDQIKSEWYKRHRNLGLGSLIERRDDSFLFYSSQISGYTFNTGFWASMVLLGQRRNIEVVYIKNNKITKIEESNILTYPSSPFIRKLYYGHTNIRYSHVTNRRFIGQFLNDFYSVYVPSLKIMKNIYRGTEQKIIEGRQILISLFRDMFREKISHISISKLFPNKDLNEKYSKDVVVDYMTLLFMRYMYKIIQKEGNINRDYITSIKEAIIKGYGTIEMGSSYSEQNPLFDATDGKGLEIKIDLSKFDESLLAKIIWTLDFDGSIEIAQFKEVKKIKNVNGKICEPIIHMYRTLLNILSSIEDHSRFFASFYIPGMGGMSDGTSLFNKFNHKYDVDSNRIEINLDDPDYKLKIASVIYYMVKYNAIISVKAGYYNSRKNVLYMSQTEILDEGYMKQAFYDKSKNIGGNLVTDALIYLSWNNQYKSGTFTLQNTFPIHDFADGDEFDKYFMNIINTRTGENFIRKPEDLHQLV